MKQKRAVHVPEANLHVLLLEACQMIFLQRRQSLPQITLKKEKKKNKQTEIAKHSKQETIRLNGN
jgi:septum formation inhibitor MinC